MNRRKKMGAVSGQPMLVLERRRSSCRKTTADQTADQTACYVESIQDHVCVEHTAFSSDDWRCLLHG